MKLIQHQLIGVSVFRVCMFRPAESTENSHNAHSRIADATGSTIEKSTPRVIPRPTRDLSEGEGAEADARLADAGAYESAGRAAAEHCEGSPHNRVTCLLRNPRG